MNNCVYSALRQMLPLYTFRVQESTFDIDNPGAFKISNNGFLGFCSHPPASALYLFPHSSPFQDVDCVPGMSSMVIIFFKNDK